jgi:hypothetical protein
VQGILSTPGIAGYKCVRARIGHFIKAKYLFHNTKVKLKTGKTGTHSLDGAFSAFRHLTILNVSILKKSSETGISKF